MSDCHRVHHDRLLERSYDKRWLDVIGKATIDILLESTRHVVMYDKSYVRLVNSHAEGNLYA